MTREERKKIKKALPTRYVGLVQRILKAKGLEYSKHTIYSVANGSRSNPYIEEALAKVALKCSQEKKLIRKIVKEVE